jgi:S1-C subfamily serine protease
MPIHAICPSCTAEYHLPDKQAGKKVRCKQCQAPFRVEAAAEEATEVVEAEVVADAEEADAIDEVEVVDEVEAVEAPKPGQRAVPPGPSPRIPTATLLRDDVPERPARGAPPPARLSRAGAVTRDNAYGAKGLRDLEGLAGPEEEDDLPAPDPAGGRSKAPWIIGGAAAALLLVGGGITAALLLRDDSPDDTKVAANISPGLNPPVVKPPEGKPLEVKPPETSPPGIKPPEIKPPETKPTEVKPPETRPPVVSPPTAGGRRDLSEDKATIDKVKQATVYIEVMDANGRVASGTGFFGVPDARNLILTNAHVVGMLAPHSRNPRSVDVFINSGQAGEKKLTALVKGVDRGADLAVLDVGTPDGMPEPLQVAGSDTLGDLQKLWVFGFPLGKRLGKEITIRDTSVSSLRKKNGLVDKIQVNGGMDPGNSGGPVVDANGQVVGVSVSGIPGRQINFAIPGENVHGILKGRVSALTTGMPFNTEDKKVGIPVTVEMLDPLNQVKQVSLEVWTGNKSEVGRPSAKGAAPARQPGDSEHKKVALNYDGRAAKGEVVLPALPSGKTYWLQPTWAGASGESQWGVATPYKLDPNTPPLDRKPISLVLRNARGPHGLTLNTDVTFRVGSDETDEETQAGKLETKVTFRENVTNVDGSGAATVDLHYLQAERFINLSKTDKRPSRLLDEIKKEKGLFEALHVLQRVDAYGNVTQSMLDKNRLRAVNPDLVKKVELFHEPTSAGLHALSVTMPNKRDAIAVGESWKAPPRSLPIDTPGKFETGSLEITYTYLGQRRRGSRDEAVIAIDGMARGGKSKDPIGGRATGLAVLDLGTGQISQVDTKVIVDMDAVLAEGGDTAQTMRVLATYDFHLKRE